MRKLRLTLNVQQLAVMVMLLVVAIACLLHNAVTAAIRLALIAGGVPTMLFYENSPGKMPPLTRQSPESRYHAR
jgi:hypothetical protein